MGFSTMLEAKTVRIMIKMYCNHHHQTKKHLCPNCQEMERYALLRIEKCPFQQYKPVCSSCEVHCYKPDMRHRIQEIMRFSGPRMLTHHPLLAIRYLYRKKLKGQKVKGQ